MCVVVARGGALPLGADEAVAEAGGAAVVVGDGAQQAAGALNAERVWWAETGYRPGALARALVPVLQDVRVVILPASPDGRDLAPRLAAELGRPLLDGAIRVGATAELARVDGRVLYDVAIEAPVVATLIPGVRTVAPTTRALTLELALQLGDGNDAETLELLEPAPETVDLADAKRVLCAGGGLGGGHELLARVAAALGASAGGTRVVTDAGLLPHDRQIGTTGAAIAAELYIALGVSGAAQHVGGLGDPRHIVSVNTDPACPLTAMADLALVTDARALLDELARRLDA